MLGQQVCMQDSYVNSLTHIEHDRHRDCKCPSEQAAGASV